jgi:hypothetical protein
MGGMGSGRKGPARRYVGNSFHIDVNQLSRDGCLAEGSNHECRWMENDKVVASISIQAEFERIYLRFQIQTEMEKPKDIEQYVDIIEVPCNFGGKRSYFNCPGIVDGRVCGNTTVQLHFAPYQFLCRKCHDMTYASQFEDEYERAMRQLKKINRRLGTEYIRYAPIQRKPKGMWHATHNKIIWEIKTAEEKADRVFLKYGS